MVIEQQHAELTTLLIGVVMSAVVGYLLRPKPVKDPNANAITTLSSRGAFLNYIIGRRKIGYIFAKAYDRTTKKEKSGSKKFGGGGGGSKTKVYYEGGSHFLLIGPGERLFAIYQHGKRIMRGPIDHCSHPSGSTIQLGKEGEFDIYWGEPDQPISAFLSDPTRMAIASRWPLMMRIDWRSKRLGPSPTWPMLEYDVETRVQYTGLVLSPSWIEHTRTPLSNPIPILLSNAAFVVDGGPGGLIGGFYPGGGSGFATGSKPVVVLEGDVTALFPPDRQFYIFGSDLPQNDLFCRSSAFLPSFDPNNGSPFFPRPATAVYLGAPFSTGLGLGFAVPFTAGNDDGPNPAHIIYQLLFGPWPYGLSKNTAIYDLDSLEVVGQICHQEHLTCSIHAEKGQTIEEKLTELMLDMGLFVSWDIMLGKFRFELIRTPTGLLPTIPTDALLPPLSELEKQHRAVPVDKLVYTFKNRDLKFNDDTVAIDDDGQAGRLEYQNAEPIELPTITSFDTAAMVAERRSQEDLADKAKLNLLTNRDTRRMLPSQAFLIEGLNIILRLVNIQRTDSSREVKGTAFKDFYGVDASTFVNTGGQGPGTPVDPDEDLDFAIVEVPGMLSHGLMTLVVPRIRGNDQISSAVIWLSPDDVTYFDYEEEVDIQTGGTLLADLTADRKWELSLVNPANPTVVVQGPDADSVAFLDDTNWHAGRQIMVIEGASGWEICHLKGIAALGGGQYLCTGLVSGRYDTLKEFHPAGSRVFIFFFTDILLVQDPLLGPGQDIYVKTQPRTLNGAISLALVTPESLLPMHGKGIVPMRPCGLRTTNMYDGWFAGQDVVLHWGYRSGTLPRTGAGVQGFGIGAGKAPAEGEFLLEFYDSSDVLKHTEIVSAQYTTRNTFTYFNTDIVTHFGSEPSEIRIKLYNQSIGGGFKSYPELLTINRL